jgi:hypothetical protein
MPFGKSQLEDLKIVLRILRPGKWTLVHDEMFPSTFGGPRTDEKARAGAQALANEYGCRIEDREHGVHFIKR